MPPQSHRAATISGGARMIALSVLSSAKHRVLTAKEAVLPTPRRDRALDPALLVPFAEDVIAGPIDLPRIAIVCHLFHVDLAPDLHALMARSLPSADLLITTDSVGKQEDIEQVFAGWDPGRVDVRVVANRGRDIAPKLLAFAEEYAGYDLLLFLHSKKSTHFGDGDAWRDGLFETLLGSPEVVRSILAIFRTAPEVGMVIPPHLESIREWVTWNGNFPRAWLLGRRMGVKVPLATPIDFPSGSMFWARPAAMAPLTGLGLRVQDFPVELGQINKTLHHAVERLILISCEHAGYSWLRASSDGFPSAAPRVPVERTDDLVAFVRSERWRVLQRRRPSAPSSGEVVEEHPAAPGSSPRA